MEEVIEEIETIKPSRLVRQQQRRLPRNTLRSPATHQKARVLVSISDAGALAPPSFECVGASTLGF